jgi:hypothetical protein
MQIAPPDSRLERWATHLIFYRFFFIFSCFHFLGCYHDRNNKHIALINGTSTCFDVAMATALSTIVPIYTAIKPFVRSSSHCKIWGICSIVQTQGNQHIAGWVKRVFKNSKPQPAHQKRKKEEANAVWGAIHNDLAKANKTNIGREDRSVFLYFPQPLSLYAPCQQEYSTGCEPMRKYFTPSYRPAKLCSTYGANK